MGGSGGHLEGEDDHDELRQDPLFPVGLHDVLEVPGHGVLPAPLVPHILLPGRDLDPDLTNNSFIL